MYIFENIKNVIKSEKFRINYKFNIKIKERKYCLLLDSLSETHNN